MKKNKKVLDDRGDKINFSEQIYERVFFSTLKIEYKKAYMLMVILLQ